MFTRNQIELFLLSVLVAFFCINKIQAQSKATGEPVPGAEIYIELETDDEPIMKGNTDHLGTYHFKDLKNGTYKLFCKLPKGIASVAKKALPIAQKLHVNFIIEGIQKSPITFGSKTGKNPLLFESPVFILEEKNNSFKVTIVTSVNNYGINDDGIK